MLLIHPLGNVSGKLYMFQMKEEFEYTEGVIIIRISKKNRQHNGQKKKYKKTNNDPQSSYSTSGTRGINVLIP
jgi:hypothetical protein